MSIPVVLLRVGPDVVPVVLGQDGGELRGFDLVHERVIPVAAGDVVGAADTNPAAVFWGMDLVENEIAGRMAAEPDHSCFPPGLQDAYANEADTAPYSVPAGRISLELFAATFLSNVESDGDPWEFQHDKRTKVIARTLYALGVKHVGKILGAGTFGTAALLDNQTIIKLTSDPSEVQAGAVLRGKKLAHVARIYESWFVRNVRAKTTIGRTAKGRWIKKRNLVGVLYAERVTPIGNSEAAEQLTLTVNAVKDDVKVWPDQLARLSHEDERARLKKASQDLQSHLMYAAEMLRARHDSYDADLAHGVALALKELRDYDVYAIDVHQGNVGYVEDQHGDRIYKVFDVGSSSPPGRPKAEVIDDSVVPEQLELPGMLNEGMGAAEWVGEGVDELEARRSSDAKEGRDLESLLAKNGLPKAPGDPIDARWIAGKDDWWVKTESGWYWLRRRLGGATWEAAPMGPPGAREDRKNKPVATLDPQGQKFAPVNLPLFGAVPTVTGYTEVRSQLEKHRKELPSVATIQLSTVFSGLTIMVGIEEAEQAFACVSRMYERLGRARMPTLAEIQDCIVPLGLIQQRTAMYESAGAWAPVVREAMERGLRDRELRRFLYLETALPEGIGLAKISFILALCGQDVCCLDARLMGRMFGAESKKKIATFAAKRSERALAAYEAVEDAFLAGNPFYDAQDPIGRARAQWQSWEIVGQKPTGHHVWLSVVV